jgi:hypothetical protein
MTETYITSAAEAGLLHYYAGSAYVADRWSDPISGDECCFVEYCDHRLVEDPAALRGLTASLTRQFPGAASIIVRLYSARSMPRRWQRSVTYVRHSFKSTKLSGDPSVAIEEAGEHYADAILEWLVRALSCGYQEQGRNVSAKQVRAAAEAVTAAPDRRSYISVVNDTAVGHLTVLTDAFDDMAGKQFMDLIDMLVEPGVHATAARAALVAVAADHAAQAQKALIGNVTHGTGVSSAARSQHVLKSLLENGWIVDHVDWRWSPE